MRLKRLVAGGATLGALGAMELVDLSAANQPGDEVRDDGTVQLFSAALAAAGLLALRRPRRWGGLLFWPGLAAIWAGIGVNRWARLTLAKAYRPVVTVVEDHHVIDTGPYAYVRHPMYTGGTLICAGLALLTKSPGWALPIAAIVPRIRVEERVLADALGPPYREFCEGRPRLIPGIW